MCYSSEAVFPQSVNVNIMAAFVLGCRIITKTRLRNTNKSNLKGTDFLLNHAYSFDFCKWSKILLDNHFLYHSTD